MVLQGISKSISVQAKFISVKFSWKKRGLAKVGVKGKSLSGKSIRFFALRTNIVGGMG